VLRLLRLLALLQARRECSGAQLAEELGVSTRTVRTDIDKLRQLGYTIDSSTGVTGGYRLSAGKALPPLLLDDDEAVAVAVGLRAAAAGTVTGIEDTSLRALQKLEQTLPPRLRHRIDVLRSATVSAAARGATVDAEVLTAIAATVRASEQLRFDYVNHDGSTSLRRTEPHRLVFTGRRWYLLAWDVDRDDWRTFRADRIQPRIPTGPRFAPREPPGGDAVAHVVRGAGHLARENRARILLHAPLQQMADRLTVSAGLLTSVDDDSCILETGSDSFYNVAGMLGTLEVTFTVLDPPELRTLLHRLATTFLAS
jgi:predicted DNA-binding transcriptional regulator YafY